MSPKASAFDRDPPPCQLDGAVNISGTSTPKSAATIVRALAAMDHFGVEEAQRNSA
jgi:hypothetical protein